MDIGGNFLQLSNKEAWSILNKFASSGWHGQTWPSKTFCVFELSLPFDRKKFHIYQNEHKRHAEQFVIDDLRNWKEHAKKKLADEITIYINYSPCSTCSKEIKRFMDEVKSPKLMFVFAQLYKINRRSCDPDAEGVFRDDVKHGGGNLACFAPNSRERERNKVRLLEIQKNVRPFKKEDWKSLVSLLFQYSNADRAEEDYYLRKDWHYLVTERDEEGEVAEAAEVEE